MATLKTYRSPQGHRNPVVTSVRSRRIILRWLLLVAHRPSASDLEVGHRSYLSTQHLWMAEHCTRLATAYENDHANGAPSFHIYLRGYVLTVIMESVAFLEALINELLADAHEKQPGHIDALTESARQSLGRYWKTSAGTIRS